MKEGQGQGQTRQMKDRRYVIFTAPDVFMLFLLFIHTDRQNQASEATVGGISRTKYKIAGTRDKYDNEIGEPERRQEGMRIGRMHMIPVFNAGWSRITDRRKNS
jgi:hypothetical protein